MQQRLVLAAATAAFLAGLTSAQNVITPPGYGAIAGNTNNAFPWNRAAASMRIQFIHDASNFTLQGITTPIVITGINYRPDDGTATTTWAGGSWPNVRIDLSTCPVDFSAATSTFSSNLGLDARTVHQGPVTVLPGSCLGAGVPCTNYITIPTGVFVYDPNLGDLVVDIHLDGTGWTGSGRAADHVQTTTTPPIPPPPLGCRVYNTSSLTATTGTITQNYAPCCEFTYVPAVGLFPYFHATPISGSSPLLVQFTDQSFTSAVGGVQAWAWDLNGDSIIDSTAQNPTFTYGCGDFNVTLTATDSQGSQTITRNNVVRTDLLTPNFTAAPIAIGLWQFTDTTVPIPTSWAWDFNGDTIIDSNAQNPVWPFGTACDATVKLDVGLNCRTASTTKVVLLAPATHSTAHTGTGAGTLTGGGTPNLGLFWDLQVLAPEGVTVCGLTDPTHSGFGPYTCNVYITADTYVGKDATAALWRLVASGPGVMAGGTGTAPSNNQIVFDAPFYLPPGNYGVAVYHTVVLPSSNYLVYHTVAQGPFSNADLVFHPNPTTAPGIYRTNLFSGSVGTPRSWKGTFHYTKVSLSGLGGYGFLGLGCNGTLGVPRNIGLTSPTIGQNLSINMTNLPLDLVLFFLGSTRLAPPVDIGFLGAPGCLLYNTLDASVLVGGVGGVANVLVPIPANPAMVGQLFYAQGASIDLVANPFGVVLSDGAALIIGQ
ncbi:MAG TPA: PKD domain-containing protein [Planctomycetota bacterium]